MIIHTDCREYRGDVPCRPHKREGVHCDACPHYDRMSGRILIIKLGAIGDVIRTTPLLTKLKEVHPKAVLHWLTRTPDVVPASLVNRIFQYSTEDVETIKATPYDILFNLDKDPEACALANAVQAKEKKGFILKDGHCWPVDEPARRKWITGVFDDENRRNLKSYPQELFEICGFEFRGEEYVIELGAGKSRRLPLRKPVIGLNTGCGARWKTRLWPDAHWVKLARKLVKAKYTVLFLGGEQEHEKNRKLARLSGALYKGHFPLPEFADLMNRCDLVVTAVTMALHIAVGLKKKVVLFNNIFNPHEFELYGRGVIMEPGRECQGCFMNDCPESCMDMIKPEAVFEKIILLLRS
jgi:ADP-heptose:LPS heptosyltransferase